MQALNLILLLAIFLPAMFFIYLGLSKVSSTTDKALFYCLSGQATSSDYTQSTVAYMLQTATTFYFIYWGYNYGMANFFYIVSWLLGILLLMRFSKSFTLLFKNKYTTLAQFINGEKLNALKPLVTFVSILGFSAIIYVETYYASMFGSEVVTSSFNEGIIDIWWIFLITFLLVSFLYSVYGGMEKVYYTDKLQLGVAYLGFCMVFSYLINISFINNPKSALLVAIMIVFMLVFLVIEDIKHRYFGFKFKLLTIGSFIFCISAINGMLSADFSVSSDIGIPGPFTQLQESYGWVTLLGFTILNLGWQFCDNSNYQRIASIKSNITDSEINKSIRKAIRSTLFSSPLTWAFGIFLGMLIRVSGIEVSEVGSEAVSFISSSHLLASQGEIFPLVGLVGFAISISSIMLSTVDTSVLSIMQMWECDLVNREKTKVWYRLLISGSLFLIVLLFAYIQKSLGEKYILVIVNGAYAQLFALSLPAIVRLIKLKVSTVEMFLSVLLGTILTWLAVLAAPLSTDYNILLVLPTLACLVGSILPLSYRIIKWQKIE